MINGYSHHNKTTLQIGGRVKITDKGRIQPVFAAAGYVIAVPVSDALSYKGQEGVVEHFIESGFYKGSCAVKLDGASDNATRPIVQMDKLEIL